MRTRLSLVWPTGLSSLGDLDLAIGWQQVEQSSFPGKNFLRTLHPVSLLQRLKLSAACQPVGLLATLASLIALELKVTCGCSNSQPPHFLPTVLALTSPELTPVRHRRDHCFPLFPLVGRPCLKRLELRSPLQLVTELLSLRLARECATTS